ncbi:MAG: S8 family serine peptidase [Myxococcota bacterium]|nr:S8 family serine peptidase [Myxococcota bacterium]
MQRARRLLLMLCLALTPAFAVFAQDRDPDVFRTELGRPAPSTSIPPKNDVAQSARQAGADFYFHKSGRRISFLRKERSYVLIGDRPRGRAAPRAARVEQSLGSEAELIDTPKLGDRTTFRVKQGVNANSVLDRVRAVAPEIFVSPVFTSEKGVGNIGVSPSVVVRLAPSAAASQVIPEIEGSGPLFLNRALRSSTREFEFAIRPAPADAGEIFAAARAIGAMPSVEWAEPNLIVSAERQLTPNDPQYPDQWHLHNTGQNGAVVDADVDAPEGWDVSQGSGMVIAIFDDGVDLAHEDLAIWANPGETGGGKESNGIDDDGNGYVDDHQGWDFGDDDNDPSPGAGDSHGTAVAGVAGAIGNNAVGVAGSAFAAEILPIRGGSMSCTKWGEAMRYAGRYGHVVNNSWGIGACEISIDAAISDVVSGSVPGAVRGALGTPVLFATGNSAGGWERFTVTGFTGGSFDFEWRFVKDFSISQGHDTVWLDDIDWPGGTNEDFEADALGSIPGAFTSGGAANWTVVDDGVHARGASGRSARAGTITDNQQTSLFALNKSVGTGDLSFWVWVSSEYSYDFFEFYVDGTRHLQVSPGQYGSHEDEVGYPASNPDTIAVGASRDGSVGNEEQRSAYSQFGPELDVVAPSSGGGQGITTTDRTGTNGYSATAYTGNFGGTSSATPLVAGIVANMIADDPTLTAAQLRQQLRDGADQIGPYAYTSDRNDFYGHGRANLAASMPSTCGDGILDTGEACDDGNTSPGDCCSATCQVESAGTVCRVAAGTCDTAEVCDGISDACPADVFEPDTTVCRSAAGVCDAAETCDGLGASCPVDAKLTSECRAAAGTCDTAEVCDGISDACPADVFEPDTTVCRLGTGVCDAPETCDGATAACPADVLEPATTICRSAAGDCDAAETCDGLTIHCPADAKLTGECRAAASTCDVAETCDGINDSCPVDGFVADGTSCDDADVCTDLDACLAGVCEGTPISGPPLCEPPPAVPLAQPWGFSILVLGLLTAGILALRGRKDGPRPAE